MKWISLGKNNFAVVDDEDWPSVKDAVWCLSNKYASTRGMDNQKGLLTYMHHVVVGERVGKLSGKAVDHKNHNRLDNRRCNVRIVTIADNNANKLKRHDLRYNARGDYWSFRLTLPTKRVRLTAYIGDKNDAEELIALIHRRYYGDCSAYAEKPDSHTPSEQEKAEAIAYRAKLFKEHRAEAVAKMIKTKRRGI